MTITLTTPFLFLSMALQDNPGTAFAMSVVQAVRSHNSHKFFQLYSAKKAPNAVTALAPYTPAAKKKGARADQTPENNEQEDADSRATTTTPFSVKKAMSKTPKTPTGEEGGVAGGDEREYVDGDWWICLYTLYLNS